MHTKNKADKNSTSQDKTSSFDETKKYVIDQVWGRLPKWSRITIVLIVIVATPIIATQSYWYPIVNEWCSKPEERIIFRGYIYETRDESLQTKVELRDGDENMIIDRNSDEEGLVTFNIPVSKKVRSISCYFNDSWETYPLNIDSIKAGKKFQIILTENSIIWE